MSAMFLMLLFATNLYANSYNPNVVNDETITYSIKQKIDNDKLIGIDFYDISTKNGVVYINGKVETDSQAQHMVQIAQSTIGVKDVDTSRLKVTSSKFPITDSYITAKVKGLFIREKVFKNEEVATWHLKVETKNGVVYLTGKAKSQKEVDNAITLAKSVRGVNHVDYSVEIDKDLII
jgi:hyperosmotically inducible protein